VYIIGLVVFAAMLGLVPESVQASGVAVPPRCDTTLEPVVEENLPDDVAAFADGAPIIGEGALYLLVNRAQFDPHFDAESDQWMLRKVVWFRRQTGTIDIVEQRSGSSLRVTDQFSGDGYGNTGFLPSHLSFPRGGCWRVTATLAGSSVEFQVRVPKGRQAICDDLAEQLSELRAISNETSSDYESTLEAASDEKDC